MKKCPYCDFNSHELKRDVSESSYINALLLDLANDINEFEITRPIQSIFIGGGTPSLFSPEAFERLLSGIKQQLTLTEEAEITLEANPGTFESQKFSEFRALGINRLSIGVQSFHDKLLQRLGRVHNAGEAVRAIEIAHAAGFENLNIDLMFGLPDAEERNSEADILQAISLKPTHISLYQLTLEPNTYFHKFPPALPDDESIFNEQQRCQSLLKEHGYWQYEISAYSQSGRQCRHNLNYWQFGDYLGIGAGAHGKISKSLPNQIVRTNKLKNPDLYIHSLESNLQLNCINQEELPLEFLMNGLRLKKGFNAEQFIQTTGLTVEVLEPALSQCINNNLLFLNDNNYACTEQGWNFLDSILEKFIP